MKRLIAWILICAITMLLAGCSKYQESDFIGKTSAQIEEEFGPFDCVSREKQDGLYRNAACGYTIKEPRKGFLGTEPEVLLFIHFDETGTAQYCDQGYRPGG